MLKRPRLDAEANSGEESDCRQVVPKSVFADAQHEARWRQSAIRQAYEKARERERDEINELAREKEESRLEGHELGKIEGQAIGKIEEKLKALPGIKAAIDSKIGHELLKQFFSSFEESTLYQIETYVTTHHDCNIEDIAQEIGLIGSDESSST